MGVVERYDNFSGHARTRAAQRNYTSQEIAFIEAHGRTFYRRNGLVKFLGKRDIPEQFLKLYGNLIGSVVVLSLDGDHTVITVYKNPQAIAIFKRARA